MASKEVNEILLALEEQRWRVEYRGSCHYMAFPPDREVRPCSIPSTPSDSRSLKNTIADLKRAGFEWPPPTRRKRKIAA